MPAPNERAEANAEFIVQAVNSHAKLLADRATLLEAEVVEMSVNNQFGFTWGPAEVMRLCDDEKAGNVIVVAGKRQEVEIRVTPSGLVRVSRVKPRTIPRHEEFSP